LAELLVALLEVESQLVQFLLLVAHALQMNEAVPAEHRSAHEEDQADHARRKKAFVFPGQ